eukprot:5279533-Pleurochrysis_carterae.AAC.4
MRAAAVATTRVTLSPRGGWSVRLDATRWIASELAIAAMLAAALFVFAPGLLVCRGEKCAPAFVQLDLVSQLACLVVSE